MTYTNEEGEFSIQAKINDSIYVSSLFHTKQFKVLEEINFNQTVIIELVKTVNELDEVYLEKINEKKFDSIKTNEQLHVQIKSDIEKNPHLYSPPSNGNMDFIAIAKLIAGLFKNKKKREKEQEIPIVTVKHSEWANFFKEDSFFNEKFLAFDLLILPEHRALFFDYCDAKGVDKNLLKKENQLLLVDTLVRYSKEFREALKADPTD